MWRKCSPTRGQRFKKSAWHVEKPIVTGKIGEFLDNGAGGRASPTSKPLCTNTCRPRGEGLGVGALDLCTISERKRRRSVTRGKKGDKSIPKALEGNKAGASVCHTQSSVPKSRGGISCSGMGKEAMGEVDRKRQEEKGKWDDLYRGGRCLDEAVATLSRSRGENVQTPHRVTSSRNVGWQSFIDRERVGGSVCSGMRSDGRKKKGGGLRSHEKFSVSPREKGDTGWRLRGIFGKSLLCVCSRRGGVIRKKRPKEGRSAH